MREKWLIYIIKRRSFRNMREFSYKKNAGFLVTAGAASQLFGAAQRIILTRFLKEEGMAIYQSAVCVYSVFLTLACGGIPLALTRYISGRRRDTGESGAPEAAGVCGALLCGMGAAFSLIMFFSRGFFAAAMKETGAEYAIAALSPSVFAVCCGAFVKSWFEGHSNMLPCAVSQVSESVIKSAAAYALTSFFGIFSAKYAAMGGALAITAGEFSATALLMLFFRPFLKRIRRPEAGETRVILEAVMSYAFPLAVSAVVLTSLELAENAVIRNSLAAIRFSGASAGRLAEKYSAYTSVFDRLRETKRLTGGGASWLYGAYFGYAMTVVRFPAGLLSILSVPFFPLAAKRYAEGDGEAVRASLFRIAGFMLSVSLPLAAAFVIFKECITQLIFGSCACSEMLAAAAPVMVFAPLCGLFSAAEYASGRTLAPFFAGLTAFMISIPLCAVLIRIPDINIFGAAIASVAGLFAETVFHVTMFFHRNKRKDWN